MEVVEEANVLFIGSFLQNFYDKGMDLSCLMNIDPERERPGRNVCWVGKDSWGFEKS